MHGERYGFVHDDNITQFFPTILQGCQSLERGVFPTYNPYQLLGSPTASVGTYALTYPLTYLSYALAAHALHDPFLTLDVFAVLHLILGYGATFVLARRVGLRPSLALCAALSFVLCGYFCVYTRCWFYMAPVALWTPLLLLCLVRLTNPAPLKPRWVLATGAVIGVYFHAGNAQMWTYSLLLGTVLIVLWQLTGQLRQGRLLWSLLALLVGLAIALPLLLVQANEVSGIDRQANLKTGTFWGFLALLFPAPLVRVNHPGVEQSGISALNHPTNYAPLYYCGPLFLGVGLLALLSLVIVRWNCVRVGANVWLLCGGVALLLSFGQNGGLAQLLSHLPGFNKFQHSWKFLPFVALFFGLGGGLLVERWLRLLKTPPSWLEPLLLGAIALLLVYNACLSQPILSIPEKPYPALSAPLRPLVETQDSPQYRSLALAPWVPEWNGPGLVASMSQNFSTVYRLPMVEGYDPLVEKSALNIRVTDQLYSSQHLGRAQLNYNPAPVPRPLEALHRYGVRWVFLTEGYEEIQGSQQLLQAILDTGIERLRLPRTRLLELSGSDPLAFAEATPERPLPLRLDATGATVALTGDETSPVIVNFLAREHLHAFVDGKPVSLMKDSWGRVRLRVPRGAKNLALRYEPDWNKGVFLGGVLLLATGGILVRLQRHSP